MPAHNQTIKGRSIMSISSLQSIAYFFRVYVALNPFSGQFTFKAYGITAGARLAIVQALFKRQA